METLYTIAGSFGAVLRLVILNKYGVLDFLMKKNGNGNGYESRIVNLEDHAKVANEEMHDVKESLVALNTKMDIVIKKLRI